MPYCYQWGYERTMLDGTLLVLETILSRPVDGRSLVRANMGHGRPFTFVNLWRKYRILGLAIT